MAPYSTGAHSPKIQPFFSSDDGICYIITLSGSNDLILENKINLKVSLKCFEFHHFDEIASHASITLHFFYHCVVIYFLILLKYKMDDALLRWKKKPHGPRLQAKAIAFIAVKMDTMDFFKDGVKDEGVSITLTNLIDECQRHHTSDVSTSTLRRWWKVYEEWGEIPYAVKIRQRQLR